MDSLINTGMHKLYLSNGRDVTLIYNPDEEVTLVATPHSGRTRKSTIHDTVRSYTEAWTTIGVHVLKHTASLFKRHAWGHTDMPDVVCELRAYRLQHLTFGLEEIDGETQVQWYIHLNKPVADIAGALNEEGYASALFQSVVCQPLWNMGLTATTPLSDISPTGLMCVSYSFHARGRRAIVGNRHYRDV